MSLPYQSTALSPPSARAFGYPQLMPQPGSASPLERAGSCVSWGPWLRGTEDSAPSSGCETTPASPVMLLPPGAVPGQVAVLLQTRVSRSSPLHSVP